MSRILTILAAAVLVSSGCFWIIALLAQHATLRLLFFVSRLPTGSAVFAALGFYFVMSLLARRRRNAKAAHF